MAMLNNQRVISLVLTHPHVIMHLTGHLVSSDSSRPTTHKSRPNRPNDSAPRRRWKKGHRWNSSPGIAVVSLGVSSPIDINRFRHTADGSEILHQFVTLRQPMATMKHGKLGDYKGIKHLLSTNWCRISEPSWTIHSITCPVGNIMIVNRYVRYVDESHSRS